MAGANLPAKKYKKTSPTVTRLSFEFDGGSTQFVDIGKALSAINRKFYRAGVYYYVNSVEIYNNETGVVDLHTLPDNWITKNAWNRGFKIFQKMNNMADFPVGKYHDFKVYMSNLHRTTGSARPSLHSINGGSVAIISDDWDYSQFTSADSNGNTTLDADGNIVLQQNADEFFAHMLGPHIDGGEVGHHESIGLIKSYAETRAQPESDATPETDVAAIIDPLMNLFDFSSEEQINDIIENLREDNVNTPYDQSYYIGEGANNMQHVARLGTEVGVGRVARASGFCAPFGLICVDPFGVSTAFRLVLNLAVGTYHGVYAERA
jgi:hypothetical protein